MTCTIERRLRVWGQAPPIIGPHQPFPVNATGCRILHYGTPHRSNTRTSLVGSAASRSGGGDRRDRLRWRGGADRSADSHSDGRADAGNGRIHPEPDPAAADRERRAADHLRRRDRLGGRPVQAPRGRDRGAARRRGRRRVRLRQRRPGGRVRHGLHRRQRPVPQQRRRDVHGRGGRGRRRRHRGALERRVRGRLRQRRRQGPVPHQLRHQQAVQQRRGRHVHRRDGAGRGGRRRSGASARPGAPGATTTATASST